MVLTFSFLYFKSCYQQNVTVYCCFCGRAGQSLKEMIYVIILLMALYC